MLRFKMTAGEFEFLTGKTAYYFDLPGCACQVSARIHADNLVELYAVAGEQLLPLGVELTHHIELDLDGFDSVLVKAKANTKLAVSFSLRERRKGELLDPTPVAVALATNKGITLSQMVRQEIRKVLQAAGENPDEVDELDLSPLDGDFDDDEEFEVLDTAYAEDDAPDGDGEESPGDQPGDTEDNQPEDVPDDGSGGEDQPKA